MNTGLDFEYDNPYVFAFAKHNTIRQLDWKEIQLSPSLHLLLVKANGTYWFDVLNKDAYSTWDKQFKADIADYGGDEDAEVIVMSGYGKFTTLDSLVAVVNTTYGTQLEVEQVKTGGF